MTVTKEQLIDALYNEYVFLCHDDYDPDVDLTPEDYLKSLKELTYEELIFEACVDEEFGLDDYMEAWG